MRVIVDITNRKTGKKKRMKDNLCSTICFREGEKGKKNMQSVKNKTKWLVLE